MDLKNTQVGKILFLSIFLLSFLSVRPVRTQEVVKFGILADVHGETDRLQSFIDQSGERELDFIIQIGDFSNGKPEDTQPMLKIWNLYPGEKYHVLGNHDLDYASKSEMVQRLGMENTYYSFDKAGFRFIVLDCNFFVDENGVFRDYERGNYYKQQGCIDHIHSDQLDWMVQEIRATDKPVVIFSHQTFDDLTFRGANPVKNREQFRQLINLLNKEAGVPKVIACFAGHDHVDSYNLIEGVHYFAVNSSYGFKKSLELKEGIYAFVRIDPIERIITIDGTSTEFKKEPVPEDYEPYPIELIHPYIQDRSVVY